MRIPHAKFLIAGGLIVAGICYLMFSGINDSMVYYYTVTEVKSESARVAGKGIRVSGHVQPGSIDKETDGTSVEFLVFEQATSESIPVVYKGLIPDTFKDNAEVVVEGYYDSGAGVFHANTLLAKCPSKYEAMGDEHPGDDSTREGVGSSL